MSLYGDFCNGSNSYSYVVGNVYMSGNCAVQNGDELTIWITKGANGWSVDKITTNSKNKLFQDSWKSVAASVSGSMLAYDSLTDQITSFILVNYEDGSGQVRTAKRKLCVSLDRGAARDENCKPLKTPAINVYVSERVDGGTMNNPDDGSYTGSGRQ